MWCRALAFLIDLVPLMVLLGIESSVGIIANDEIFGPLSFVLLLGYYVGMDYQCGGTPGKRLMGLRVALPSSPIVPLRLIARAFVKIFCLFPPLSTIYGLVAIWRKDGRSLADFVAGSTVIEASSWCPPRQAPVFERLAASILMLFSPWIVMIILIILLVGSVVVEQWLLKI